MKRMLSMLAVAAIVSAAGGIGFAGSGACDGGTVPSSTTPAGIGVAAAGDPATGGSVTACNNGAVVPSPAKGSATISVDAEGSGYAEVDGDADNSAAACTDGFIRVAGDSGGPHLYQSGDGNFADTDPSTPGNQAAQEQSPDAFAQGIADNCG